MKLVTAQSNHHKRPLKMRVAKADIYTRASSIPTVRFEDQEFTSFGGIVVFQKLFAKLNLKERLRRSCAHLAQKNLYHPAVIVQWLIVHLLLGFRKLRDRPRLKAKMHISGESDRSTLRQCEPRYSTAASSMNMMLSQPPKSRW